MEKRSRRRTRDLVTQAASQGLSQNEIGCARISMMARSTNAPCKGRIQMRKTNPLHLLKIRLATHGRSGSVGASKLCLRYPTKQTSTPATATSVWCHGHKVAALQPAAREQEPRGRHPVERTAMAGWQGQHDQVMYCRRATHDQEQQGSSGRPAP